MKRLPVKSVLQFLAIVTLLFSTNNAFAGPEYESSDIPPRVRNILFSEKSVGFVSNRPGESGQEYFILGRKATYLQTVSWDIFSKNFEYRGDIIPAEVQRPFTILKASNGMTYRTKTAYCSEGQNDTHKLWEGDRLLEDHVKPCHSVSSVEIVGDKLWLGTRYDGEGGSWPAEGINILSLKDGKLAGKINKENGLSGNLVEVIRIDPYSGKIWVATRTGFTVVDKNGKVENKSYFYEDFDPETGKPVFFLTPEFRESNLLVGIERKLGVEDTMAYYKVAQKIPEKALSKVSSYGYYMGMFPAYSGFLPEEMNVLVPFFLEAAKSGRNDRKSHAIARMCAFNDKRAIEYLQTAALANPKDFWIRRCIDEYAKKGLLSKDQESKRETMLLEKVKKALAELRSGNASSSWHSANSAIEATKSLNKMGNLQGFTLMEKYFATFDLKRAAKNHGYLFSSNELYSEILSRLYWHKEITPILLIGIKKGFLEGCRHFDTSRKISHGEHLDVKYAQAIVIAMDLADERPQDLTGYWAGGIFYSNQDINKIKISDPCEAAFSSQIKNKNVKKDFVNNYYPKLTKRQKELADLLISGQYKPDVEKIRAKMREKRIRQQGLGGIGIGGFPPPRP